MPDPPPPPSPNDIKTAVICAIPIEGNEVDAYFDHAWDHKDLPYLHEKRTMTVGYMGHHPVVQVWLSEYGKGPAAAAAQGLRFIFEHIDLVLIVGVCAGKPGIPFGDVIISNGLIPYDKGKEEVGGFIPSNHVLKPDPKLAGFLQKLGGERGIQALKETAHQYLREKRPNLKPPISEPASDSSGPEVHFGLMASGDKVIKREDFRDGIKGEPIGFEMEAAGAADVYRGYVMVIKGVCDYANEEKKKDWQPYAAATGAAYMRSFLDQWGSAPPKTTRVHEVASSSQKELPHRPPNDQPTPSRPPRNQFPPFTDTRPMSRDRHDSQGAHDPSGIEMLEKPEGPPPPLSTVTTFTDTPDGRSEDAQSELHPTHDLLLEDGSEFVEIFGTRVKSEIAPIYKACKEHNLGDVRKLLRSSNVNANSVDSDGRSLLHAAIGGAKVNDNIEKMRNIAKIVDALCSRCSNANARDRRSLGPIHYCVKTLNMMAAERLLEHGADINLLNSQNYTPLHYMALDRSPDVDFAKMLIKRGGKLGLHRLPALGDGANKKQWEIRQLLKNVGQIQPLQAS